MNTSPQNDDNLSKCLLNLSLNEVLKDELTVLHNYKSLFFTETNHLADGKRNIPSESLAMIHESCRGQTSVKIKSTC